MKSELRIGKWGQQIKKIALTTILKSFPEYHSRFVANRGDYARKRRTETRQKQREDINVPLERQSQGKRMILLTLVVYPAQEKMGKN